MEKTSTKAEGTYAYQLFMLVLCLFALIAFAAILALPPSSEARKVFESVDLLICIAFFVDFLLSLKRAPNKKKYLVTWGWIDLLSSIPTVDALRVGRLARVVRILRVLRAVKATRIVANQLLARKASSALYSAAVMSLLLVVMSSLSVLHFESEPGSNIRTADTALWWAFSTITTVGYGDFYPVTTEGRIVAAILMASGMVLIGVLTAAATAWFLSGKKKDWEEGTGH